MSAITIKRGNDFSVTRFVTDSSGAAVDLSGFNVTSEVRPTADSPDLTLTLTVDVVDPTNGEVTLSATAAETDVLTAAVYKYDINRENGTINRNTNCFGFTVQGIVTDA